MSPASEGCGHGVGHHLGELCGGLDRPGRDDRSGDAPGEATFAAVTEQRCELGLGRFVHELGRRTARALVHAHVEGGVEAVGEAALCSVELRRAHTEVEEDPADLARVLEDVSEGAKASMVELGPSAEGGEPHPGRREGVEVAVETDQA